ncbi:MAG: hypothetical protein Q9217_001436 [Psora testacea]
MSGLQYPMLPSPPSTHRSSRSSRRKLNVSEESSSSTGSVMIDTTSKYRIGIPSPLRALPLESEYPHTGSPAYHDFLRVSDDITIALLEKGVRGFTVSFVQRFEPGDTPTEQDWTVLICTTRQERWVAALEAIHELLLNHGINGFGIEILDSRATQYFYHPVVTDEFRNAWSILQVQIIGALGLGPEWQTLSIFNRGHIEEESTPTVTVGLTKAADLRWQAAKYELLQALLEAHPEIEVAYVRSNLLGFTTSPTSPAVCLDVEAFTKPVQMGSSIGIESSGTLGGYVTVRYQGQTEVMGLTNHHVIATDDMTIGELIHVAGGLRYPYSDIVAEEKANGYSPDLNRPRPRICAPSNPDTEMSIKAFEGVAEQARSMLDGEPADPCEPDKPPRMGLRAKLEALGDEATDEHRQKVQKFSILEANNLANIATIKQADRDFGRVFASSGLQRRHGPKKIGHETSGKTYEYGGALDWALLRLKSSRVGDNTVPTDDISKNWGFIPPPTAIIDASRFEPRIGQAVFKKGRNGFEVGHIKEFGTQINFNDGNGCFSAWTVLGGKTDGTKRPFMYPGDSGCWCLDQGGDLIGLGFAGQLETDAGYFIPISHVYDDIRQKFGAEIVSPVLQG